VSDVGHGNSRGWSVWHLSGNHRILNPLFLLRPNKIISLILNCFLGSKDLSNETVDYICQIGLRHRYCNTMSTVPRVAAEWMILHLPSRDNNIVHYLETAGLGILNINELKCLADILYSMVAVIEELSIRERLLLSSVAKKDRRINFLRRGLFRDDPCTIVNDRLMRDMRLEIRTSTTTSTSTSTSSSSSSSSSSSTTSMTTTTTEAKSAMPVASSPSAATRVPDRTESAASSTDSRKRPNHQISLQQYQLQELQRRQQQQQQQLQLQQNRFSPEDAAAFFDAYYAPQFNLAQYRPVHHHGYNPLPAGMPIPAALLGSGAINRINGQYNNIYESTDEEDRRQTGNDSGASAATAAAGSSSSADTDPQSTPHNPTEAILLQQLLQMGFLKQEILDGIRQCRSGTAAILYSDEVMLHLVSQREEAEEARKEDEVRLRSEDQKQEESQRREQNQKESLSKATTGEDLNSLFPESWVLKVIMAAANTTSATDDDSKGNNNQSVSTILRNSDSRNHFLEFLKLEEKSRKWYGWILPSEYFRNVGKRLKSSAGDKNEPIPSWATILCNERKKLRCGLYELKEQLNGQPKIFLDQRRPEKKNCGATEIVIIDHDDDDDDDDNN
jgi:hypothetical protein